MKSIALAVLTAVASMAFTTSAAFATPIDVRIDNPLSSSSTPPQTFSYFCETGDPGGGGPVVDIEKVGSNFKVSVSYNRRDLERTTRGDLFKFEGPATAMISVQDQGANCIRHVFNKPRTKKTIEFTWCDEDQYGIVKLLEFTKQNPDFDLGCSAL